MKKRFFLRQREKAAEEAAPAKKGPAPQEITRMLATAGHCLESGQPTAAEGWCRRVLALEPANTDALNLRGLAAAQLGRPEVAMELVGRALAAKPQNPVYNCNLGILLAEAGRAGEALDCFERALAAQPDNLQVLANLIELYEKTNQLDKARQGVEQALRFQPRSSSLRHHLAKLEFRQGNLNRARVIASGLLDEEPGHELAQKTWHLLAQICDRQGESYQAYKAMQRANLLAAATPLAKKQEPMRLELLQLLKRQRAVFRRDRVQEWGAPLGDRLPRPVFLVGFPRSGTTLAGQLLTAHPGAHTVDEARTLDPILRDFFRADRLERLASLGRQELLDYRQKYFGRLQEAAGGAPGNRLLVDKNPLYICYLGFIQRFFPEARVIVMHRDPRDTCLSNFMQDFTLTPYLQNFLTLENTVGFYETVMGLYSHYRRTLPLEILEVRYEDLVTDLRGQMERMLGFIGLEWDEAVTTFFEGAGQRFIRTPSYQQVVQPLYASAMGRWKTYEVQLAEHMPALQLYVDAFGYR